MSQTTHSTSAFLEILMKPLEALKKNITAYDLFALTVAIMIFGHVAYFFIPDETWPRLPDRIFICVFLVPIGYNAGRKVGWMLWSGAIIICLSDFFLNNSLYVGALGTIIIVKIIIDPLMTWLIQNNERFWLAQLMFAIFGPITNLAFEYGTTAIVFASAGWLLKNRGLIDEKKIDLRFFYIFAFATHMITTKLLFPFSELQLVLLGLGTAVIFWLLYDFKRLLLNSLRRRPKDPIEKFCHFIGHKSMEIYVIHLVAIQLAYYYFVSGH